MLVVTAMVAGALELLWLQAHCAVYRWFVGQHPREKWVHCETVDVLQCHACGHVISTVYKAVR